MTSERPESVFSPRASLKNGAEVRFSGGLRRPSCTARTIRDTTALSFFDGGEHKGGSGPPNVVVFAGEEYYAWCYQPTTLGGPVVCRPSMAPAVGRGPRMIWKSGTVARIAGTPPCGSMARALENP